MFAHGPPTRMISSRIAELLETAKQEFEQLAQELTLCKRQRDEFELKITAQVQESQQIQQQIYEMDRTHKKIKQQYEEEIMRLRRQLEALGVSDNRGPPTLPVYSSTPTPGTSPSLTPPPPSHNSKKSKGVPIETPVSGGMPSMTGNKRPRPGSDGSIGVPTVNSPPTVGIGGVSGIPGMNSHPSMSSRVAPSPSTSFPRTTSANQSTVSSPSHVSKSHQNLPPINLGSIRSDRESRNERDVKVKKQLSPNPNKPYPEEKNSGDPNRIKRTNSSAEMETEGTNDWLVCYNPSQNKKLVVDLAHTLEHNSVVCCVKFSTDGKYLATGCNKSAQIYDVETGVKAFNFPDGNGKSGDLYIRSVCFSPDTKLLITGAEDKTVKVWDIQQKTLRHTLEGHELDIYSLDFSKDGQSVVSGSGDKKVKIWDVETGKCLLTLGSEEVGPKDGVTSVSMGPDGRLVSAGSLDRIVRLWDARSGFFLDRYEGHSDSVYSVAFSPDGKSLASGSLDKSVRIWDLGGRSRSRCKSTLNGHKDFVLSVAYSPDGKWLVSGSKDRSLQFWG
eukprot:TRINITY_DN2896_c0_g1_i2.p1 TRINITY_DN2896_c0_g1~~TRINITY_DN2896_c0_g1_i2.p1  ORF type:complete len:557 (+),score=115.02 TRINITY_DN2896_c0_g1_i2:92-1762(+)